MLKAAIFDPFFRPQAHNYNPVLWTMSYELLGSFLTFGFIALFGGVKRRWIVYVVLFIALCQTYFAAFLLGLLLADLWRNRWASRWLAAGVLLLGIYLGSAPYTPLSGTMYAPIETTVLHINSWLQLQLDPKVTAHTLGATMILFAVLRLSVFQWFFGLKPFAYLGKISFSIYLIHFTFLNSFSAYLFIQILPYTRYNIAFGFTFVFSMIPLFWLSHLYMHYVDEGAIKLSKIIEQKIK
ncbi:Acyltransferase family protein [compost metagenome]